MKTRNRHIFIIVLVIMIISAPLLLCIFSKVTKKQPDIRMNGFFDTYERPSFSISSYMSGDYQKDFEAWQSNSLLPKNIYISVYNQIQYSLFELNNRIVGENKNIFEYAYIRDELCLDGFDYSIPSNEKELSEFINVLDAVDKKLQMFDKTLLVYTTPSKAHWEKEDIPSRFLAQTTGGTRAIEVFREKIRETEINYLDCDLFVEDNEYPAFYNTGIHWSRTLEQKCSVKLIDLIKDITHKQYRNLILGNVQKSKEPFWRDSDVYDLTNLLFKRYCDEYYQYDMERELPLKYDKLRLLLQGDSFAQGLLMDYFHTYLGDEIYYVNYSTSMTDDSGTIHKLNSWDDLDVQFLLDNTDVIAIQMDEALISNYSSGFAQFLNTFLDSYVPGMSIPKAADRNLDPAAGTGLTCFDGFYWYEPNHVWAKKDSFVTLRNEKISENGIEFDYVINENVVSNSADVIHIYVNQVLYRTIEATTAGVYQEKISSEELVIAPDDTYDIDIICQNDFNPKSIGMSEDNRDLALDILYIGEVR